ncbi:MAG: T9SS type A sorting domain-containing protein [Bacteroidetes bacterium]|nr:T9SS type A sorting domain-containing protein [Bacteroidota bacterium]
MKKIATFFLMIVLFNNLYGQLQDRIWIFGRPTSGSTNATLYFGNLANPVVSLPCGQPSQITPTNGWEEWGVVTDPVSGNLIFYTDGQNVFDAQHNLIDLDPSTPGFESMGANCSSSQPVALCPIPDYLKSGYDRFFIFSNPTGSYYGNVTDGPVTYRIYDVNTSSFGPSHNMPGPYGMLSVSEGLKLIPSDTDPNTLWLITSLYPNPGYETKYVIYKIYKSNVTYQGEVDMGPVRQTIGVSSACMNIIYTKAGTTSGISRVGMSTSYPSVVMILDFDNVNGQFLTNTLRTYVAGPGYNPGAYDCEFSPSGRFIYFTEQYNNSNGNNLYQIDLLNTVLSATLIHNYPYRYSGGLGLGPDSLIYHISNSGYDTQISEMGRILQPDVEYIPGTTNYNQFYEEFQNYYNTMAVNFCEFLILPNLTSGIPQTELELNTFEVSPNPATDQLTITIPEKSDIEILDTHGQSVKNIRNAAVQITADISGLAAGMYFIRVKTDKETATKKFIKL